MYPLNWIIGYDIPMIYRLDAAEWVHGVLDRGLNLGPNSGAGIGEQSILTPGPPTNNNNIFV